MKKILCILFAAVFLSVDLTAVTVYAESKMNPIYADSINDGEYSIEVDSSSSMFKVVDCRLVVSDGKMSARMTMSGQGYGMVFLGTGDEALAADDSMYIDFTQNADGQKVFEIPLEALDKKINCAAWSIKKEQWYDRELVFKSESLPDGALKNSVFYVIIIASAIVILAAAAIIIIFRKKHGGK